MRRFIVLLAVVTAVVAGTFAVVVAPTHTDAEGGSIDVIGTGLAQAVRGGRMQVEPTLPPPDTGTGKRAVFSLTQQRVWLYDSSGWVIRTFLVSARLDMPNPGTYQVTSRSSYTCSIAHRSVCMRFMIRFAKGPGGDNIGFHEIPRDYSLPGAPWLQSEAQLGQPLSDGCLREATADAEFMWAWAPVGTKVVVIP